MHALKAMVPAVQACDPREFLLFLPQLTSTLREAAGYMHECACMMDATKGMENIRIVRSADQPLNVPQAQQRLIAHRKRMLDVLEHILSQAAASFGCLKRRNATLLVDVLSFIHEAEVLAVYFPHLWL